MGLSRDKLMVTAFKYYGLTEIHGISSNPTILSMIKDRIPEATDDSVYAWCGLFINHIFKELGWHDYIPDKPQVARNWQKIKGIEVSLEQAQLGDIVVFWRGSINSWKGHVALFINNIDREGYISVLGGNQNNQVNIKQYASSRILKIIRPTIY